VLAWGGEDFGDAPGQFVVAVDEERLESVDDVDDLFDVVAGVKVVLLGVWTRGIASGVLLAVVGDGCAGGSRLVGGAG
jgi:hypothetical protein